jgi:two-component sensor histidine kinase
MAEEAEGEAGRLQKALEAEVARRTHELQAALDEAKALLHDLDHRAKNNLQALASLTVLKARRMRDPASRAALTNMAERIGALSTAQRLLYADGGVVWFELREFLTDLTRDLMSVKPAGIDLSLDVDDVAIAAGKAAPLALLVNELVGNALRHAFPHGRGRLRVSAKLDGGLRIAVEDDGIGLADHTSSKEAFGKDLIDMLARQLRGAVAWEDAAPGTRAVLVMPLGEGETRPVSAPQSAPP